MTSDQWPAFMSAIASGAMLLVYIATQVFFRGRDSQKAAQMELDIKKLVESSNNLDKELESCRQTSTRLSMSQLECKNSCNEARHADEVTRLREIERVTDKIKGDFSAQLKDHAEDMKGIVSALSREVFRLTETVAELNLKIRGLEIGKASVPRMHAVSIKEGWRMQPLVEQLWLKSVDAPPWAKQLVRAVWKHYGDGPVPRVAFCGGPGGGQYHGWKLPSQKLEKVVLLHELSHALVTIESNNFSGKHTRRFYEIAVTLYNHFKADADSVLTVESRISWR
jgi:hypothetical protein